MYISYATAKAILKSTNNWTISIIYTHIDK